MKLKPRELSIIKEKYHLSQQDLAQKCGVSPATIKNWEKKKEIPDKYMKYLTEYFDTSDLIIDPAILKFNRVIRHLTFSELAKEIPFSAAMLQKVEAGRIPKNQQVIADYYKPLWPIKHEDAIVGIYQGIHLVILEDRIILIGCGPSEIPAELNNFLITQNKKIDCVK